MYDIRFEAEFEQCAPDKGEIRVIPAYAVIHYITAGEGIFNGKSLSAGQFFAVNKNQKMVYAPDKKNPWSYLYIRLYGQDVNQAMQDCGFGDKITIGQFQDITPLSQLLSLYHTISKTHPNDKILGQAAANLFFLLHAPAHNASSAVSLSERHVQEIKAYLDKNYHQKLSMDDVAKKFFLSRAYIRNLFVRYLGISPKQYLQQIRLRRACELLKETDLSIGIIANSVGYEDALLFSKIFSVAMGISPNIYRKTNQGTQN